MAKHSIQITDNKLYESIVEYCKENGLKASFLCTDMLRKQFLIEKFGDIPFGNFQDSSVSYDDKSVTSSVIGPLNTNGDAIVVVETIDKNSDETAEEKQKLSLESENNNNAIITSPLDKEIEGRYTQKEIPNKFYSEITIDSANKASEETQKHTEKPKKRRL